MAALIKKLISFQLAYRVILVLNSAVILFHLLILSGVIPFTNVWGGRLKSVDEMYVFETISILLNIALIVLALLKRRALRWAKKSFLIDILLWIFAVIFVLNTLGNIVSFSKIEAIIATPLTFILAICCARLAISTVSTLPRKNG